jgi:hypothetical protein
MVLAGEANAILRRWLNVRFGSLADIVRRSAHVRFTPQSGHQMGIAPCLLCERRHRTQSGEWQNPPHKRRALLNIKKF